jgi:hypothetical protein
MGNGQSAGPKYCNLPGCTALARVEKGKTYDYCTKEHGKQAKAMNIGGSNKKPGILKKNFYFNCRKGEAAVSLVLSKTLSLVTRV